MLPPWFRGCVLREHDPRGAVHPKFSPGSLFGLEQEFASPDRRGEWGA